MRSAEDDAIMARFVADYLALLDQRILSIQAHLGSGNEQTAHVAMLSLESTSTMVGVDDLAHAVAELRAAVENHQPARRSELIEAMVTAAAGVPAQLGSARAYPSVPELTDHAQQG